MNQSLPANMQGVWLEALRLSLRRDLPVPEPASGYALVKVRMAGICATDLELTRGYYPYTGILGHEFVGQVVASPSAPHWLGRRVVGEINLACGECFACRMGMPTHCERRTVLGIVNQPGAFAQFLSLPLENLHPVPDSVPDEAAVFTEPLAAALQIQQQVQIKPTDRLLVIGAGRLGQLIAQTLALTAADLCVVARHPVQRELLAERGIRLLSEAEVSSERFDLVVEATGSPAGFHLARQVIRPRGTLVLKSTYHGEIQVNFSPVVVDEITLVGSRCGPFPPALRLLESGRVDPRPLIVQSYPLDQAIQAFEHAAQPGVLKILLTA
jgi:threonine dehydrogenase-like Zn-dependent dehydrogenase